MSEALSSQHSWLAKAESAASVPEAPEATLLRARSSLRSTGSFKAAEGESPQSWMKTATSTVRSSIGAAGAAVAAPVRQASAVLRPVILRPNQSPMKTVTVQTFTSPTGTPSSPKEPKRAPTVLRPVSLRPNQAPARLFKEDAPEPPSPKHGSGVSAQIFEQPFEEPAGASTTFTHAELKKPINELPKGVDPRKREQYLTDADFVAVLGTTRAAFEKLRGWRQNELKRKVGLF